MARSGLCNLSKAAVQLDRRALDHCEICHQRCRIKATKSLQLFRVIFRHERRHSKRFRKSGVWKTLGATATNQRCVYDGPSGKIRGIWKHQAVWTNSPRYHFGRFPKYFFRWACSLDGHQQWWSRISTLGPIIGERLPAESRARAYKQGNTKAKGRLSHLWSRASLRTHRLKKTERQRKRKG